MNLKWKRKMLIFKALQISKTACISLISIFPNLIVEEIHRIKKKVLWNSFWPTQRKKCLYSELFWPAFFPHLDWIRRDTEYMEYLSVFSPNAGKCGKNADQNSCEYVHFLRSAKFNEKRSSDQFEEVSLKFNDDKNKY